MNWEEAHNILEDFQREMTAHRYAYSTDFIEAHGNAILALEKQIPKKPISYYHGDYKDVDMFTYCCAECHHSVSKEDYYCRECGQRLDWSDKW